MKLMLVAGCALAAVALSGCAGLSAFNSALIPELKPIGAGIEPTMKCSDLVDRGALADANTQLTAQQTRALFRACEEMQAGNRVIVVPQGARKAIGAAIAKAPLTAGTLAAGAIQP